MPESKTDRRILKTKKGIRDALTKLMEEKGFEAITVKDLTEKADINRGTFYLHYQDKYDLLEQSEADVLAQLSQIGKAASSVDLEDFRRYVIHNIPLPFVITLFECIQENAPFMKAALGPKGDPSFQAKIKEMIKRHLVENILRKLEKREAGVPVDLFSAYITSAHLGVIQQWLAGGMTQEPKEMALILLSMTFKGPAAAIGLASF
ncbi:TetR/AcrR family transcriptional regulator [Bacillus massiliglaciei]|uniref:TetR/AcrR family transcriptional regulator n=1 Tax=Bacillus massiliglaciei TaxID=1816693 RepID=UPI000B0A1F9A|nr:TetR/AcrR family transcriptional regulator [Bacillus massiliglaciei]